MGNSDMRKNGYLQFRSRSYSEVELVVHSGSYGSTNSTARQKTAHDWEDVKNVTKYFYDDGTMTFFWNAHTITAMIVFFCAMIYVAILEDANYSSEYAFKRALIAVAITFLIFGVIHTPDGPFRRPHPAFWRLVLAISSLYELFLVFILFLNLEDARHIFTYVDEKLADPLPEKNYAGNCLIYDMNNTADPFHNVWDKMDCFVSIHFFGWWLKALILRDFWLCHVISFMFEILEYSLEHQLPNFAECWWDHWVMDFLLCNLVGIHLGMETLHYLSIKPYHWRGMWKIPGYKGKFKRIVLQFTPHRWTDFDWRPTDSLIRWVATLALIAIFLAAEVNVFYLKYIFYFPPSHFLCTARVIHFIFMGAASMREAFQYLDDPTCKRLGQQFWLICSIIITELLIIVKFAGDVIYKPPPIHICVLWTAALCCLMAWTFWHFYMKPWIVRENRLRSQKKNGGSHKFPVS